MLIRLFCLIFFSIIIITYIHVYMYMYICSKTWTSLSYTRIESTRAHTSAPVPRCGSFLVVLLGQLGPPGLFRFQGGDISVLSLYISFRLGFFFWKENPSNWICTMHTMHAWPMNAKDTCTKNDKTQDTRHWHQVQKSSLIDLILSVTHYLWFR